MYLINLIRFTTCIIPVIAIIAGLSASVTISLWILLLLLYCYKTYAGCFLLDFISQSLKEISNDRYVEYAFICWASLSSIWSINSSASLGLCANVFMLIILCFILQNNIKLFDERIKHEIEKTIILGVTIAIILFLIEKFSAGIFSNSFRRIFQNNAHNKQFALHMLDRGCALLSVISWSIILILINNSKYLIGSIFYIIIFSLLYISDSAASLLAYACAGVTFILLVLFKEKICFILKALIIIAIISTPFATYHINPYIISTKYENIPISSVHRLFIWNFVGHKILESPIIGIGVNGSKYVAIDQNEIVAYKGINLSPLPLHPHNNILQISLELGAVGLLLFALLVNKWLNQISAYFNINKYFCLTGYACFVNYLVIGMISYNMWQIWWICTGLWSYLMLHIIKR